MSEQYIDIPAEQLMAEMEAQVKNQVDEALKTIKLKAEVDRLEWTAEGIRLWLVSTENDNKE